MAFCAYRYALRLLTLGLILGAAAAPATAQREVRGTVTDAETRQPLPGVNVVAGATGVGAATDVEGRYRLLVPAGVDTLRFSFTGYVTQRVAIGGRSAIDVALVPDARLLGDVVVTALGIERQERELGYAIQRLDAADFSQTEAGNLVASLAGRVAGAQVINSGGAPGQGVRVVLRGLTSLQATGDNQPLFVVDGIPIDNSTSTGGEGFNSRGFSNRGVDLNPGDIETVSVLNGAAATALYGQRAANGAVLITTRRGQAGPVQIQITSSVSAEQVNRFPVEQQVYTQGFNGVYDPTSFWCCWGAPVEQARQTDPNIQFYQNFRRAYETGYALDNNVTVSGGTNVATFFASLGRFGNEGVLPFSSWGRTSARLNSTIRPSSRVTVSGSFNYVNSGGNRVFADRFNERLVYWSRNRDVRDYIYENGTMIGYYGTGLNRSNQGTNPIYDARFATYRDDVNRFIGSGSVSVELVPGLTALYRAGIDTYSDNRFATTRGPLGFDGENPLSPTGNLSDTRIFARDLTSTVTLTGRAELSPRLRVEGLLGNDVFERYSDQTYVFGSELTIPDLFRFNNVRDITTRLSTRRSRLVGVYGSAKAALDNALFLEVTGRNDWTSTLAPENRSFFYPSVSLGYVFTEHMSVGPWLDFGKLRASVAQVGKDTEPYRLSRTFAPGAAFPLGGQTGFTLNPVLGSADLRPERTTSLELGTDLRALGNRLRLDATYYDATSRDQIIPVPISNATGFASIVLNAGAIRNTGVELKLNTAWVMTPDVSFETSLNLGRNRNTVVEIRDGIDEILIGSQFGYVGATASLRLIPGAPYGAIYGRSYARYYGPDGEPPANGPRRLRRDLPILIGADGFPVIDNTQRILGNMTPDLIGGVLNRFRYRSVELTALIDFSIGGQKYNQFDNFFSAFGISENTLNRNETIVFEGVTADGQRNTRPVWLGQGVGPDGRNYGAGFYRNIYRAVTENHIDDASYVKLRSASVAYLLPAQLTRQAGMRQARVRFATSNHILWTPYRYFDPEVTTSGTGNEQGFSGLAHPGVSSYTLTLELGI